MLMATVDPRSSYEIASVDACETCCCETVNMRPGETNLMVVNYAPWAVPFARKGLDCATQFHVEQMKTCPPPTGSDLPPRATQPVWYAWPQDSIMVENLNTRVADPEGRVCTYKVLPFYSTTHGKLILNSDGSFTYQSNPLWWGYDRFFFEVTDGTTAPVIMECVLAIGNVATPEPSTFTQKVTVGPSKIDNYGYTVSFPIAISPAVQLCEIFRLTVKQGALDCDCNCYHHVSCYDIRIGKC